MDLGQCPKWQPTGSLLAIRSLLGITVKSSKYYVSEYSTLFLSLKSQLTLVTN